jgi:hypothetical protein
MLYYTVCLSNTCENLVCLPIALSILLPMPSAPPADPPNACRQLGKSSDLPCPNATYPTPSSHHCSTVSQSQHTKDDDQLDTPSHESDRDCTHISLSWNHTSPYHRTPSLSSVTQGTSSSHSSACTKSLDTCSDQCWSRKCLGHCTQAKHCTCCC